MIWNRFIKKFFNKIKHLFNKRENTGSQNLQQEILPAKFKYSRDEFSNIIKELIVKPEELYLTLDNIKLSDIRFADYWKTRMELSLASVQNVDFDLEYDDDIFISRFKIVSLKTVIDEFNEIYIELANRRSYYFREIAEPCDLYEKESVELFKKRFIDEVNDNIKQRFMKIREDIQRRYDEQRNSGIISKLFRNTLGPVLGLILKDDFVKEVVNKHIEDEDMRQYVENFLKQLDRERIEGWIKKEKSLAESLKNQTGAASYLIISAGSPDIQEDLSTASKVGGASVAAVAGSTAILAAGWHTLTWAMSGLFIWAMPVALVVTGIISAINKDSEHNKLMKSIEDTEADYLEKINEYFLYRILPEIASDNNKLCHEIKKEVFAKKIGRFEVELLDQLIYKLEDYINLLRIKIAEVSGECQSNLSSWLIKADNLLKEGDNVTAAIVSSHAFEDLLHQLNIKFGTKFNFRQQGHNQVFIDNLATNNLINEEHRRLLHSLRERRNNFTHRIHLFSMWNKNRQTKEVKRFIDDLNILFEYYIKV